MRVLSVLLASVVLALAGCGGGTTGDVGGGAADVVPADVALYVSGNTDFDGEEWQAAEDLVGKFPAGERAIADLLSSLESEEGVSFEEDVKPALGPETAVAVLPVSGEPVVVGLTQPPDPQKLDELLAGADRPLVSAEVEGWTVFAEEQSAIDRFEEARGGGSLAESEDFQETMDGLEDGIVSVYGNGQALQRVAESNRSFSQAALDAFLPGGEVPSFGAVVLAEEGGARLDATAVFAGDLAETPLVGEPYEAELPGEVPGDVLAYISFSDLEQQLSAFRDRLAELAPEAERQLGQAEGFLGVSIEEDLAPLFAGEGALYVRGGTLIPEVTLVTQVEDEEQAVATLDDVVAGLGQFVPFLSEPQTVDVAGVQAREVPIEPPVSLYYGAFDGKLVVTTAREGIADLREDGERFAESDAFAEAKEQSGLPDETAGWAYMNLADVLPLLLELAGIGGEVPEEVRANTEPLRSLVFYSTVDGERVRFSLFLGVE